MFGTVSKKSGHARMNYLDRPSSSSDCVLKVSKLQEKTDELQEENGVLQENDEL